MRVVGRTHGALLQPSVAGMLLHVPRNIGEQHSLTPYHNAFTSHYVVLSKALSHSRSSFRPCHILTEPLFLLVLATLKLRRSYVLASAPLLDLVTRHSFIPMASHETGWHPQPVSCFVRIREQPVMVKVSNGLDFPEQEPLR